MPKGRTWIKAVGLIVFSVAAVCCAVLGLQVLCKKINMKAGIMTLSVGLPLFNLLVPTLANKLQFVVQLH